MFVTLQDSDLRSALLLEQAAHCFINMRNPMVRKFAFHMILAGHRFSKAGQVSIPGKYLTSLFLTGAPNMFIYCKIFKICVDWVANSGSIWGLKWAELSQKDNSSDLIVTSLWGHVKL